MRISKRENARQPPLKATQAMSKLTILVNVLFSRVINARKIAKWREREEEEKKASTVK